MEDINIERMYVCTLVHLCICALVQLCTCTIVQLYTCTLVHLYNCTIVQLITCTIVQLITCTILHLYTCTLVYLLQSAHVGPEQTGASWQRCEPGPLRGLDQLDQAAWHVGHVSWAPIGQKHWY